MGFRFLSLFRSTRGRQRRGRFALQTRAFRPLVETLERRDLLSTSPVRSIISPPTFLTNPLGSTAHTATVTTPTIITGTTGTSIHNTPVTTPTGTTGTPGTVHNTPVTTPTGTTGTTGTAIHNTPVTTGINILPHIPSNAPHTSATVTAMNLHTLSLLHINPFATGSIPVQTPGFMIPAVQEGQVTDGIFVLCVTDRFTPGNITIDWGDGSPIATGIAVLVAPNTWCFESVGSGHVYAEEGSFNVKVAFRDSTGTYSFTNPITVTEAPLTGTGVTIFATEGTNTGTVTVANFSDTGFPDPAASYSASFAWGDGGMDTGTVVQTGPNAFAVQGNHTYQEPGTYTITVTIMENEPGAPTLTVLSTAIVSEAPLTPPSGPFTLNATEGQLSSLQPVANFTDTDNGPADPASEFVATVKFTEADGTTTFSSTTDGSGNVVVQFTGGSPGAWTYQVLARHTYNEENGDFVGPSTICVEMHEVGSPANALVPTANANVAEAPLVVTGQGFNLSGTAGTTATPAGAVVALFDDTGGGEQVVGDTDDGFAAAYTATIFWGDGSSSPGTINSLHGNHFSVTAPAHTYQQAGTYTVTVDINHETAPTLLVTDTATIAAAGFTGTPTPGGTAANPSQLIEGEPTPAGFCLATFSSANPFEVPGNFTVTVTFPANPGNSNGGAAQTITQGPGSVTQTPDAVTDGQFQGSSFMTIPGWTTGQTGTILLPVSLPSGAVGVPPGAPPGRVVFLGNSNATIFEPTGTSFLSQTITVPTGTSALHFFVLRNTTDSVAFDPSVAQIRNAAGNVVLATIFSTATNDAGWVPISFDLTPFAGQTVQIYFAQTEDGFGDPTGMYVAGVSTQQFCVMDTSGFIAGEETPLNQTIPIIVTVTNTSGGPRGPSFTVTDQQQIQDANLDPTGFHNGVLVINSGTPIAFDLGYFFDPAWMVEVGAHPPPQQQKDQYKAFIDWGDGSPTQTVSGHDLGDLGMGRFDVTAPHTYNCPFDGEGPNQMVFTIQVDGVDVDGLGSTGFTATYTVVVNCFVFE
jgi:hypothetical protein